MYRDTCLIAITKYTSSLIFCLHKMSFTHQLKSSYTMTRFEFSWKMIPESRSRDRKRPITPGQFWSWFLNPIHTAGAKWHLFVVIVPDQGIQMAPLQTYCSTTGGAYWSPTKMLRRISWRSPSIDEFINRRVVSVPPPPPSQRVI